MGLQTAYAPLVTEIHSFSLVVLLDATLLLDENMRQSHESVKNYVSPVTLFTRNVM